MMKDNMPDKDFIFYSEHSPLELSVLLEKNPGNIMAFQYLVACQLLNFDLREFPTLINNLIALGYKNFPRHFEEALIVFMIHNGDMDKFKNLMSQDESEELKKKSKDIKLTGKPGTGKKLLYGKQNVKLTGRPKRDTAIGKKDAQKVGILLKNTNSVDEFLKCLE